MIFFILFYFILFFRKRNKKESGKRNFFINKLNIIGKIILGKKNKSNCRGEIFE